MLVNTIHGEMDESLLEKKEGGFEDDNEKTTWVEYWLDKDLVHRSAHVTLKAPPTVVGEIQEF
jgi:hypothetical protein